MSIVTEMFMLSQFKDVNDMYATFNTIEEVQEYQKMQDKNITEQIGKLKELSANDRKSENS